MIIHTNSYFDGVIGKTALRQGIMGFHSGDGVWKVTGLKRSGGVSLFEHMRSGLFHSLEETYIHIYTVPRHHSIRLARREYCFIAKNIGYARI